MSLMMLAEYYKYREKDAGTYFKVHARNLDGQNCIAFRGMDDDTTDNPKLKRQHSQDRHVAILKKINDEMYLRRLYNGTFDRLA